MAKINHNNFITTINDYLAQAKDQGILHLQTQSDSWQGRYLDINGKNLINFGTCGYLGLESDSRIIDRGIKYLKDFGAQFSISRGYVTSKQNYHLEDLLEQIFLGKKVLVFSSTTLAHIAVLPIIVEINDAIIFDQQVHISIQNAAQLMAVKGVPIDLIRHNNLDMLERKIKELSNKHQKIWYMIDGIYSMYGDIAPIEGINYLLEKYPKFHLYIDDAHGMGWTGTHGNGSSFEHTLKNERTILVSTLAKGFGTMGGIVVFPNEKLYKKVHLHGGPLAYSHPLPPPNIGSAIASAEIHLSDEIYSLQNKLSEKLNYCNELLAKTNLPIMSDPKTPIYFIGTGQPKVGYNLNKKILNKGYYVNIAMFPAVPVKNTGLRFTITNHLEKEDIKNFIDVLREEYDNSLQEEGAGLNKVRKAFKLPPLDIDHVDIDHEIKRNKDDFTIEVKGSIKQIDKDLWNSCFKDKGPFDWAALKVIEKGFSENDLPEENWEFHYIIIRDSSNKVILATFLTSGVLKDDLLETPEVSKFIEEKRKSNKYYLTSKSIIMGSMVSDGDHLFLDRDHPFWNLALQKFVDWAFELQEKTKSNSLILRDFHEADEELTKQMNNWGFVKIAMPNTNVIFDLDKVEHSNYVENLTSKGRRNVRNEVIKNYDLFEQKIENELDPCELNHFYELILNVASNNYGINIFNYPKKIFQSTFESENWEFFKLYLKENMNDPIAIICSYKSEKAYYPLILGMDYEKNHLFESYKQILYRVVERAIDLKKEMVYFGLSADFEKKKLGATSIPKIAFVNIKDEYSVQIMANISS